jgi:putative ABC transport system ATP-binding protein
MAKNSMKPIIQFKNVSVHYERGKSNETAALQNINLEIFEGEYIVFFGPSGCGKSTLLYTIAGLETATEGDVIIRDENLKDMTEKERINFYRDTIGMVFQAFYLVSHLSAKDNMMLSKMFAGEPRRDRENKAQELMDKFGITPYANRKPSMLSGGQQQRTAIGRALMNNPEIILADEPVGNLDSKNAETVLELLALINKKEKKTVIQVTHNPKDIHYADRVFYMKDGRIERVVLNTDAARAAHEHHGELSEFEKLEQANPNLSAAQLRAKFIVRSLLVPYDIDTEQKIESAVARYIKKEITEAELVRFIDDPKSGAGLYIQKAKRLGKDIEEIVEEIERIAQTKHDAQPDADKPFETEAITIRKHLLDAYQGTMDSRQIHALEQAIEYRIENKITNAEFQEFLRESHANGGLGLNRATAKKFAKYLEVLLTQ